MQNLRVMKKILLVEAGTQVALVDEAVKSLEGIMLNFDLYLFTCSNQTTGELELINFFQKKN